MCNRTRRIILVLTVFFAPHPGVANDVVLATLQIHGTRRPLDLESRAGEPFDPARVERDVRRLWATGWFEDIEVLADETARGMQVTFDLAEKPRLRLRRVRFEPGSERVQVETAERGTIDVVSAARVAATVQKQLVEQGFVNAQVVPKIVSINSRSADLVLKVNRGELLEFEEIRFAGNTGLEASELRNAFASIRPHRILPSLGPLWGGWRIRAPYSRERLEAEIEKLRSLYLSRGYFDAHIGAEETRIAKGRVAMTLRVESGQQYSLERLQVISDGLPMAAMYSNGDPLGEGFCRCLHRARKMSEKRGELAFTPRMEITPAEAAVVGEPMRLRPPAKPAAFVTTHVESGPVYHVGRIEFRGHRAVGDSTLRKALIVQEGDLFDAGRLRRGLAQLNRIAPVQGVDPVAMRITPEPGRGLVHLIIPARERPRGFWKIDGPLGPLSAFGPLSGAIGSRLPAGGRGPLELSTYYMTFSVAAWPTALAGIAGFGSSSAWRAVTALQRPYVPGQRWSSGILVAPQFGWRGTAAGYGVSRFMEAARAVLRVDSTPAPGIAVPVAWRARAGSDEARPIPLGAIQCAPPKPRLAILRTVVTVLLDSSTTLLFAAALQ